MYWYILGWCVMYWCIMYWYNSACWYTVSVSNLYPSTPCTILKIALRCCAPSHSNVLV